MSLTFGEWIQLQAYRLEEGLLGHHRWGSGSARSQLIATSKCLPSAFQVPSKS